MRTYKLILYFILIDLATCVLEIINPRHASVNKLCKTKIASQLAGSLTETPSQVGDEDAGKLAHPQPATLGRERCHTGHRLPHWAERGATLGTDCHTEQREVPHWAERGATLGRERCHTGQRGATLGRERCHTGQRGATL